MRYSILAGVIALFTPLISAGSHAAQAHFQNGERLLKEYQWVFAAREFEEAVHLDSTNRHYQSKYDEIRLEASQWAVSAAQILIPENRLSEAQTYLGDALRFDPKNAAAARMIEDLTERMKDPRVTNADVIEMAKGGLSAAVIADRINTAASNFDKSAAALVKLKSAGVSNDVIRLMVQTGETKRGGGTGTGFFITSTGYMLTNEHVITGCKPSIRVEGVKRPLEVILRDHKNDLALLKSMDPAPAFATFSENFSVRVGEAIFAAGYPLHDSLASSLNLSAGIVSAAAGFSDDAGLMQITAPIQPGNSGGPLLDGSGHVVGIVRGSARDRYFTAITEGQVPQNVNFAIKGSVVRAFLESNDVKPSVAPSTDKLEGTVIADQARRFTWLVTCE